MDCSAHGVPSLHTRVESWECDYNGHWNTRYFGRSFQLAAETVASSPDASSDSTGTRHIRFHRELGAGANVEVRSARLQSDSELNGAIVHVLTGGGRLSATALDLPGTDADVPGADEHDVRIALPRGIEPGTEADWSSAAPEGQVMNLGTVQPAQCDHSGNLLFDELVRCSSVASNFQMQALGLTPESTGKTRVTRMAVELRIRRFSKICVGTRLSVRSRLTGMSNRSIRAAHLVASGNGQPLATLEYCLVTVDIDTRRAVPVPEYLRRAWQAEFPKGNSA